MTLTEFLLARIAEDEAEANATIAKGRGASYPLHVRARRVLAECEAKRQIVDEYRTVTLGEEPDLDKMPDEIFTGLLYGLTDAMQWLAVPYADHPDYDEAWRP